MKHGEEDEEIQRLIRPNERDAIAPALRGIDAEMRTFLDRESDDVLASLVGDLGAFMSITCGGWPMDHREEWLKCVTNDLMEFPIALVLPAIRRARKKVWEPKRFLSWIVEEIEADYAKLLTERNQLQLLADKVGVEVE